MFKTLMSTALACVLLPAAAAAEPAKLKLSFYTSDRANVYLSAVKPFVEAVNAEAKGLLEIEVFFSGALSRRHSPLQPQIVLDGTADMAFIIPGMTPDLFPDNVIIELPGLFRDLREATYTYTRLVAANALKGYAPFHVIGAYGSELESFHVRPPVASLDSLQGKKIRVNNPTEAAVIEKLGMSPALMPLNTTAEAISNGSIDGAMAPASMLFEFGIARVASHHYFLNVSSAPLALVINRKALDRLPAQAQDIIRKYSGKWTAARFVEVRATIEQQVMDQLKADKRRNVIFPSQSDTERATAVFKAVTKETVANNEHHRKLLELAKSEIAKLRSSEQ